MIHGFRSIPIACSENISVLMCWNILHQKGHGSKCIHTAERLKAAGCSHVVGASRQILLQGWVSRFSWQSPSSASAQTLLLLQIFNYSMGAHSPPYFCLANKASRGLNYYSHQDHFSGATIFKKNAKVSSIRPYLINRCSQCEVCGRPRGSRAVRREQDPQLARETPGTAVDSPQPH